MLCHHCHRRQGRARGLCQPCTLLEGVRELYPLLFSRFRKRGVAHTFPHALAEPTAAMPGSAAKVAVLEERAEKGLVLWHPDDGGQHER